MNETDPLLELLRRFHTESVEYVLVGGQAVRLNGFVRATEDIDILLRPGLENGEKVKRALAFLPSAKELKSEWFVERKDGTVENIRVADELLINLLFSANGETYDTLRAHIRNLRIGDAEIRVLDIDGLLKTKTDYREKDVLDKQVLLRIKRGLESG